MRDKTYLLTYQNNKNSLTFAWFDTESEMSEFVENEDINVIEALYVKEAEVLL
ncbi:hypothetical protein [Paenibacillus sp. XY044]|uniref:hypothetical protein n=1 Tax=Paenibacillus sp. XY044 TaxID=2026089 RepID=UPI0015C667E4|nr:hypothetical protein [Paenibacillus sp. XY044]